MPPQIKLYTLSTCSHCKNAKRFLNDNAVRYDFIDIDMLPSDEQNNALAEVKKINPGCTFPTIIIGGKVIVGFKEKELREALGLQ